MTYRYTDADPRERPAHYMYAPFEGPALLAAYTESRRLLARGLEDIADGTAPVALPAEPGPVNTTEQLRRCAAAALAGERADTRWPEFFLRKIEVTRRLRAGYGEDGRMSDARDAGSDAYASAAALFAAIAEQRSGVARLRWLNACLKTLDLLSVVGSRDLSADGARRARRACALEATLVRELAAGQGVTWP